MFKKKSPKGKAKTQSQSTKSTNPSVLDTNPMVAEYNSGATIQDIADKHDKTVAEVVAVVVK